MATTADLRNLIELLAQELSELNPTVRVNDLTLELGTTRLQFSIRENTIYVDRNRVCRWSAYAPISVLRYITQEIGYSAQQRQLRLREMLYVRFQRFTAQLGLKPFYGSLHIADADRMLAVLTTLAVLTQPINEDTGAMLASVLEDPGLLPILMNWLEETDNPVCEVLREALRDLRE